MAIIYIKDYRLVRFDHTGNVKRGGVYVCFKESLPVSCLSNPYLKKCLIFEVSINNKRGYVVSIYRAPSQTSDDFNSFITNLEKLVVNISSSNPHFILMIGNFNAKSSKCSSNETTPAEGNILENSSSCIDLIFSKQPNLIMDSGVHSILHSKCHHQIIHSKLNFKIEYPPHYTRKIWDYNRSETHLINRSIESFD